MRISQLFAFVAFDVCGLAACGARSDLGLSSAAGAGGTGATLGADAAASGFGGVLVDAGYADRTPSGSGGTPNAGGTGGGSSADSGKPWRDSLEPFCAPSGARIDSLDVWSDRRGVFVLLGSRGKEQIWSNSGQGWNLLQETTKEGDRTHLSGFDGGALVKYGSFGCGVSFVEGDRERCMIALSDVNGFFGVRPDLAYATHSDLVLIFDGVYFQQLGAPLGTDPLSAKQSGPTI